MLKSMLKFGAAAVVAAVGTIGAASVAAAQPAQTAQTPSSSSGDILITARKRAESLQKVPVAVTALTGTQLQQQGIKTATELAHFVPSVIVVNNFSSPTQANFEIRGQVASDILLSQSPAVGLYEDGVNIPHATGTNLSLVDLQRVEILKGPQGTLYGRNTTGGAVNIISRNADYNGLHGYLTGEIGNFDDRKLTGAVNVPIINDVLAVRLAGQVWTRDGFGKSIATGQDIGTDHNDRFGRLSVRFDPTPDFTSTTKVEYARADQHGTLLAMETGVGDFFAVPAALNATGQFLGLGDIYKTGIDVAQNINVKTWHAVEDMTWSINDDLKLRSITGYHTLESFQTIDSDGSIAHIISSNIGDRLSSGGAIPYPLAERPDQKYEAYSQEFDLSGHSFGRLDWLVGLFGSTETASGGQPNTFGGTNVSGVLLPHLRESSWGIFTQNDLHISDRVSITAGLRYSAERQEADVTPTFYNTTTGLWACQAPPPSGSGVYNQTDPFVCTVHSKEQASGTSYLLSFNFQLTPTQLLYIKTSRGFRGGAVQQRAPDQPAAAPEFATDYEIGLKNEFFNRKVKLNLDYYHTNYDNKQQSLNTVGPFGIESVVQNAATAQIDGVEVEGQWFPIQGLSLYGNGSYTNGKYTSWPCAATTSGIGLDGIAYAPAGGGTCTALGSPSAANAAGLNFPNLPKWQYAIGGRYEHHVGPGILGGQLDWTWHSKPVVNGLNSLLPLAEFIGDSTQIAAVQAAEDRIYQSVGLLNGRIDYKLPDHQITLAFFATNLLDKKYQTTGFSFGAVETGYTTSSGTGLGLVNAQTEEPRMFGVSLTKAFGAE